MPDDRNEMRGLLFKNDKQGKISRADYTGKCQIDGREYYIDAWKNTSKQNEPYLGLRFNRKLPKNMPPSRPQESLSKEFDDDIPF